MLEDEVDLPQELAVVGGGPTGCELALELAEKGHSVSILEMMDRIGKQYEAMTRKLILGRMQYLGVRMYTGCRITDYDGQRLSFENGDRRENLDVPLVILALGAKSMDSLSVPLEEAGVEVLKIGDCKEPRGIKEAIYEGAVACWTV